MKDQNWFAVAIDFAIVVVGVFIAFQITNWNEELDAALGVSHDQEAVP